jgi:hypothetical protein
LDITSDFTDSREKRATSKETQESRVLNYNPYSPFSPLNNEEFDSKQFLSPLIRSNIQTKASNQSSSKASRIRKSYYIPKPQTINNHATIITDEHVENCRFHSHKVSIPGASVVPIPVSDYSTRYIYMRGQQPATAVRLSRPSSSFANPTPGPVKGGFHYLDYHHPQLPAIIPTSSKKVKFYDDSSSLTPSRQHFHPSYYPSDVISYHDIGGLSVSLHQNNNQHPHNTHQFRQPKLHHSPGWSQSTTPTPGIQYGTIGNDYSVIDTAIVLPKDMKSFEIPRYGYLIYKNGPPFYIIPADTDAFENAHFIRSPRSKKTL